MAREDVSLLEALREDLGVRSVKDGCSPQGQCGCCTVLVDGAARVSCVTPIRRVAGRAVSTVDGLPDETRCRLVRSFLAHGASQCGFCTPGILCRLAALSATPPSAAAPPATPPSAAAVEKALLAHLCRCTGWRSIVDAVVSPATASPAEAASARAGLEGGTAQSTGPDVVLGRGGFADDTAPAGCLVAVPMATATAADLLTPDGWSIGSSLADARVGAGKVQGRRSGQPLSYPVEIPPGEWDITLQTTWVEPAYLEPDASWCEPGGTPASPVANGGAFGGKTDSLAPAAARMLADHHGRTVRLLYSREDVVRFGPKRPPVAAGVRLDGGGIVRLGLPADSARDGSLSDHLRARASSGWLAAPAAPAPPAAASAPPAAASAPAAALAPPAAPAPSGSLGLTVETVPVAGPPVSPHIRAAGWAEAAVVASASSAVAAGSRAATVTTAEGARATAEVDLASDGWPAEVRITIDAGEPLDETVLRSYVQGAAHMAVGWVCSEGIALDEDGVPTDLTIRSFGVPRAKDTPRFMVEVTPAAGRPPVRASDAVFAAVAAATWLAQGLPSRWPTMRGSRR